MFLEVGYQAFLDGRIDALQVPGDGNRGLGIEQVGVAPVLAAHRLVRRSLVEVVQAGQVREVHVPVGDPGLQRLEERAGFRREVAGLGECVLPARQPGLYHAQVVLVRSDQGLHFLPFGLGQLAAGIIQLAQQCRGPADVLVQLLRIDDSGLQIVLQFVGYRAALETVYQVHAQPVQIPQPRRRRRFVAGVSQLFVDMSPGSRIPGSKLVMRFFTLGLLKHRPAIRVLGG